MACSCNDDVAVMKLASMDIYAALNCNTNKRILSLILLNEAITTIEFT
jgi:hypothetical protein